MQRFQACHLRTFNVADIFSSGPSLHMYHMPRFSAESSRSVTCLTVSFVTRKHGQRGERVSKNSCLVVQKSFAAAAVIL